jgi:hypothetical protein
MQSIIPPYFLNRGMDHFSPSQANIPLDVYVYKYLECDQEKRRKFKIKSSMQCGNIVGDTVAARFTGQVDPKPFYDNFKYWEDDLDQARWEYEREQIKQTVANAMRGLEILGIKPGDKVVFENYVNLVDDELVLPIIGRTDIQTPDKIVELKTSWSRKNKPKKDGTFSFSTKALPTKVMSSHLQQASFYYYATKKPTWILHVNGKEKDGIMMHEVAACKHKEALHNMITDLKIKQEIAKLDDPFKVVQPDFTKFQWEIGDKFLDEAKEMYGYKTAE